MGEGRSVAALLRCFSSYRYASIRDTILPYPVLPCEIFLRFPVKITVQVLAAGCQLSYREPFTDFLLGGIDCVHCLQPIALGLRVDTITYLTDIFLPYISKHVISLPILGTKGKIEDDTF